MDITTDSEVHKLHACNYIKYVVVYEMLFPVSGIIIIIVELGNPQVYPQVYALCMAHLCKPKPTNLM